MDDQRVEREVDVGTRCNVCGSADLQDGTVNEWMATYFIPSHRRFLSLRQGASVSATVCLDCGTIRLSASPDQVRGMLKEDS